MLCETSRKASRALGPAALYSSAEMPSFPSALPEFVWRDNSLNFVNGGRQVELLTDLLLGDLVQSCRVNCGWSVE